MRDFDVGHVFAVTASIEFWINRHMFIDGGNDKDNVDKMKDKRINVNKDKWITVS
jgi:hypothetical protein